jgi:hypothetical protein
VAEALKSVKGTRSAGRRVANGLRPPPPPGWGCQSGMGGARWHAPTRADILTKHSRGCSYCTMKGCLPEKGHGGMHAGNCFACSAAIPANSIGTPKTDPPHIHRLALSCVQYKWERIHATKSLGLAHLNVVDVLKIFIAIFMECVNDLKSRCVVQTKSKSAALPTYGCGGNNIAMQWLLLYWPSSPCLNPPIKQ